VIPIMIPIKIQTTIRTELRWRSVSWSESEYQLDFGGSPDLIPDLVPDHDLDPDPEYNPDQNYNRDLGPNYKKILQLSYDVIITYDNRNSNLR